jgi:uncharacterized membrane protein
VSDGDRRPWVACLVGAGLVLALAVHVLVLHHVVARVAMPAIATLGVVGLAVAAHVAVLALLHRRLRRQRQR